MDSLVQDLRFAVRRLRAAPGFTLAVVATLAIGIGGAAATFSVVDAVALRPLPFPDAARLVRLRELTPQGDPFQFSDPDYLDFAGRLRTLSAVAAMRPLQMTMTGAGDAMRVDAAAVTPSLFPLLDIQPVCGRVLTVDDERDAKGSPVALISHALWRQRLGGDARAIGRVVMLDGRAVTIVGVLPETAVLPTADLWLPLAASTRADRSDKWLDVIGRLAPGVGIDASSAEAAATAAALGREHPELQRWSARAEPLQDWLIGPGLRRMAWILLGSVAVLLALACVNIAGLLMTRVSSRRSEMGIRAALGAARSRLVRQLATESLLLGLTGGAAGLLTASWALDAVSVLLREVLPLGRVAAVDGRVIAAAGALMLVSTIAFGLLPAWHAARADAQTALRGESRSATARAGVWSGALVSVQVMMATVLLIAASLLAGSFARLSRVDAGFEAARVLTGPVLLPAGRYPEDARPAFFAEAISRLTALPGVESAAATATNPFRQWGFANGVTPVDRAADAPASGLVHAGWRSVTPGFFATLQVPIVAGRSFTDADRQGAPRVAVVSQSLAARLWPGARAVGQRFYWGGVDGHPRTVVGVVGDIRDVQLDAPVTPTVYLPYAQVPLEAMTLLVRAHGDLAAVSDAVRRQIGALDPSLPPPDVRPLAANRAAAISAPRLRTVLLAVFGGVALLLACVGLYGVVAYAVVERSREIAIRVALGARPAQVMTLFFRRGARLTAIGVAAGLALAWAAADVLKALLFQTDPRDPWIFVLAAGALGAVALAATYLPARRAARLDPLVALNRS
ncbi:MAG TPA: ABC transporter permease [Vicinamibacterales bacterium]